jgi:hypothetical protein
LFVACTPADISDDKGLIQIIKANLTFFKKKRVNTPKITVLLDNGYHKQKIDKGLQICQNLQMGIPILTK